MGCCLGHNRELLRSTGELPETPQGSRMRANRCGGNDVVPSFRDIQTACRRGTAVLASFSVRPICDCRFDNEPAAGLGDVARLHETPENCVMAFVQLEGLGFCPSGTAHRFVRETSITVDGEFPVNTGGGQLSAGQAGASGGMIGVVEGVMQLMGRAGARQIASQRGLVSGYGMIAYGRGLSSSVAILERAN